MEVKLHWKNKEYSIELTLLIGLVLISITSFYYLLDLFFALKGLFAIRDFRVIAFTLLIFIFIISLFIFALLISRKTFRDEKIIMLQQKKENGYTEVEESKKGNFLNQVVWLAVFAVLYIEPSNTFGGTIDLVFRFCSYIGFSLLIITYYNNWYKEVIKTRSLNRVSEKIWTVVRIIIAFVIVCVLAFLIIQMSYLRVFDLAIPVLFALIKEIAWAIDNWGERKKQDQHSTFSLDSYFEKAGNEIEMDHSKLVRAYFAIPLCLLLYVIAIFLLCNNFEYGFKDLFGIGYSLLLIFLGSIFLYYIFWYRKKYKKWERDLEEEIAEERRWKAEHHQDNK